MMDFTELSFRHAKDLTSINKCEFASMRVFKKNICMVFEIKVFGGGNVFETKRHKMPPLPTYAIKKLYGSSKKN
jgi:hypothetical protein